MATFRRNYGAQKGRTNLEAKDATTAGPPQRAPAWATSGPKDARYYDRATGRAGVNPNWPKKPEAGSRQGAFR